ncbi:MAG: prepilin-type N-terminal cleavage/methylation domain-containing protein [Nibricoccus sp.]
MKSGPGFFRFQRRRGFTLLEVLVALAIFVMMAIVLGATYINILNSYEAAGRAVNRDEDVRFARAALLAEADIDVAERGAEFDSGNGRHVKWTASIAPTSIADLFTVTFTCEITGQGLAKPETTEEVFRLLRPTWSQPADRDKLRADAKARIQTIQQELGNKR